MSLFDLGIVVVYVISMVVVGIVCRGRQNNATDYFSGHGGFPHLLGAVLVGLSIAATFFSGISVLAYPSIAFQQGASVLVGAMLVIVSGLLAGGWFLPRYLRTGTTQPYEIIERKFGYPTRAAAAILYLILRVAWMGTLIYAPTAAVIGGFGLDPQWFWVIVPAIGLTSTVYTVLGGIRGVIVTDALQFLVIIAGIILPVYVIVMRLDVGWGESINFLRETNRLKFVSLTPSFVEPFTLWSMMFGFTVGNLGIYVADQMALQRYLAADNLQEARKAFLINISGVIVVVSLLVTMGLSLALFYGLVKPEMLPARADDVFPYFLATELPMGAPGLIFAALLSATMSSMTSGINALAGTLVLDFRFHRLQVMSPKQRLKVAKAVSLAIGIFSTLTAGLVGMLGSIFEIAQTITGTFLGPLLACMLLAVSDRKFNAVAVRIGMGCGLLAGWGVILSPADRLWVGPAATVASLLVPGVDSLIRAAVAGRNRMPHVPDEEIPSRLQRSDCLL